MNVQELYKQYETFSNLAENTDETEAKARFTKLRDVYLTKFNDAKQAEITDRYKKLERRVTLAGVNMAEWREWAETLYTITPTFELVSTAKQWKTQKSWQYETEIDCLEKIEQLIGYKIYDRKRGHGDVNEDLAK